jgi:hypothetical protein
MTCSPNRPTERPTTTISTVHSAKSLPSNAPPGSKRGPPNLRLVRSDWRSTAESRAENYRVSGLLNAKVGCGPRCQFRLKCEQVVPEQAAQDSTADDTQTSAQPRRSLTYPAAQLLVTTTAPICVQRIFSNLCHFGHRRDIHSENVTCRLRNATAAAPYTPLTTQINRGELFII